MALPVGALGLGIIGGVVAYRVRGVGTTAILLPLLLNVIWLADPTVALARSRFLFGASVWLAVALGAWTGFLPFLRPVSVGPWVARRRTR